MPSPDETAAFLRSFNTSDRARALAFDAIHNIEDDAEAQRAIEQLPFSRELKAQMWDLRQGGTIEGTVTPYRTPRPEDFTGQPQAAPQGSAARRFGAGLWETLNPIEAIKGIATAVANPIDTAVGLYGAHKEQFDKAKAAYDEGRIAEMFGHGTATVLPLIGPAAAQAAEYTVQTGDVAGGIGRGAGLIVPVKTPAAVKGAVRRVPASVRNTTADALEQGAAARVADVMSPKVGRQKVRLGNRAEAVAPAMAKDLAERGAPLTRESFHADVVARRAQAQRALDEAADARLASQTFETQPIIDALLEKRRQLTAEAVEGSRRFRAADGPPVRGARVPEEFGTSGEIAVADIPPGRRGHRTLDTGEFAEPRLSRVPLGRDVVPGPNAARVRMIDQAIAEIEQLGPVARYEPIRRIRQAYDGPAETIYNPSMTADYLTARGGKLGAADVTGVLREQLAQWDPGTAAANADFHLYKTADDVLSAVAEVERTRPRTGRQIMARLTGMLMGSQAGPGGAVAGLVGGPLLDNALASGMTTKLKTAALMQRLADAIRTADVQHVNVLATQMERELAAARQTGRTLAPLEAGRLAEDAATRTAGSPTEPPPVLSR